MKSIDQYKDLLSYAKEIEATGLRVPIKIMGAQRPNVFYTLSMLHEVWSKITDPDTLKPFFQTLQVPFGELRSRGAFLHTDKTYSTIVPHATGANHFQGDIIETDLSNNGQLFPKHKLSMIITHTCDIQKLSHVLLAPIFLDSELTLPVITKIKEIKPPKDQAAADVVKELWSSNEMVPYMGLPLFPNGTYEGESPLVCFQMTITKPRTDVFATLVLYRLKYRAMAYLQGRLTVLLIRDVQNSDETREL